MIISKIELQKRNPKKVNLYINGKYNISINRDLLEKFPLKEGTRISNNKLIKLKQNQEYLLAREKALRLLTLRPRSVSEIRQKLIQKKFNQDIIEQVINYLKKQKLLDDYTFAQSYIENILTKKPAGRTFIINALRKKGIDKTIIDEIIQTLPTEETTTALEVGSKLLKRYQTSRRVIDQKKQQQRIANHLLRRGFEWSTTKKVLSELFPKISLDE